VINFYDHYDPEYTFYSYRITKIRMYDYPSSIVIEIHSLSPGMIIGIKGETLERLKFFFQARYLKPITIKLEETNPFK